MIRFYCTVFLKVWQYQTFLWSMAMKRSVTLRTISSRGPQHVLFHLLSISHPWLYCPLLALHVKIHQTLGYWGKVPHSTQPGCCRYGLGILANRAPVRHLISSRQCHVTKQSRDDHGIVSRSGDLTNPLDKNREFLLVVLVRVWSLIGRVGERM
jgi:hypothetical protein